MDRRKFIARGTSLGVFTSLIAVVKNTYAASYVAVVQCAYCGTGFRVDWNGTDTGYGVYQCPKCGKGSRVHWDQKGVQRVEKA